MSLLVALVEIVLAVVSLVENGLSDWVLVDAWAQAPLAIVLIVGVVGLLSGRRWYLAAIRVYAYFGVVLGLAAVLSGLSLAMQVVRDVEYGILSVWVVMLLHFAIRGGYATLLAVLVSKKQKPKWLARVE